MTHTKLYKVLVVVTAPVHYVVETGHNVSKAKIFKSKRHAKVGVGVVLMLSGSALATHPVTFLPHFIWDALCYLLHGYGSLPVVRILCERVNLETLEEVKKEERKMEKEERKLENKEREEAEDLISI